MLCGRNGLRLRSASYAAHSRQFATGKYAERVRFSPLFDDEPKKSPRLSMRTFVVEIWIRGLLAVDFHFDVVVHVVGGVAVTVEANVLCIIAFGIDQLAVACIDVRLVGAFALLCRVVVVVVE